MNPWHFSGAVVIAKPQISAKTITASMPSPLDELSIAPTISCSGFSGMRSRRNSRKFLFFSASCNFCSVDDLNRSSSSWRLTSDSDLPGCSVLTNPTPISTAELEKIAVKSSVFSPSRPSFRGSPMFTIANASAESTSGTTTIDISRRKTLPIGSAM